MSLPTLSLLQKLASGWVDAVKVTKMLIENGSISKDCDLVVDEMYLKKSVQFHSGYYVGADSDGIL